MRKIYAGILICLFFTNSFSQNEVVMAGAGTLTCKEYMDQTARVDIKDKDYVIELYEGWIKGYLSGRNRQLSEMGYKTVELGDIQQIGAMLTFVCGNAVKQGRGKTPIFVVVDRVYSENFQKLVKEKSL